MSQAAIFEAIRVRFKSTVSTPNNLETVHDNAPEPALKSSWCRFSVAIDDTRQAAVGVNRYRSVGSATANLFVPVAKGDKAALDLADAIVVAFRGVALSSPLITFSPAPSVIGTADRDDSWCRRTVRIPFRADTFDA